MTGSQVLRLIVRLHRWAGLSVGLVFVLLGLTGSVLTYAPEIDGALHPALAGPPPAGWEAQRAAVLARIEARTGADAPGLVRFPGPQHGAYELWLADDAREYLDPLSGAVVFQRRVDDDALAFMRALHVELLAGARGELVLGWLGVAMLILLGTGLWLWWPRHGGLAAALARPRSRALGPQLHWWHRTLGTLSLPLLGLVTLTGVAMVFHGAAEAVLTTLLGGERVRLERTHSPQSGPSDWPTILATLDAEFPAGRTVYLYPSTDATTAHAFRKRQPTEWHPNGRTFLIIDRAGRLLAHDDATQAALGMRATNAIYPVHAGRTGHAGWQALVALLGLLPAVLAITGTWLWWRSR